MHDSRHIANYYIDRGVAEGKPLTHLQVQKLVYFAHSWMLAIFDEPMLDDDVEVWRYGPVLPAVYYCLSHNRSNPITVPITVHPSDDREFTDKQQAILNEVYEKYAPKSGMELSAITHMKGTPWQKAKSKGRWYITDKSLKRYYSKVLEELG